MHKGETTGKLPLAVKNVVSKLVSKKIAGRHHSEITAQTDANVMVADYD